MAVWNVYGLCPWDLCWLRMQYADVCTVYGGDGEGEGEKICGFDPDVSVLMVLWCCVIVWLVWWYMVLVVFYVDCDSRCGGWVVLFCKLDCVRVLGKLDVDIDCLCV